MLGRVWFELRMMLMALMIRVEIVAREMSFADFLEGLRLRMCFLFFSPGEMIRGWVKRKTTSLAFG